MNHMLMNESYVNVGNALYLMGRGFVIPSNEFQSCSVYNANKTLDLFFFKTQEMNCNLYKCP